MKIVLLLTILLLAGCASWASPMNECRITALEGKGRVGSLTQYFKGKGVMVRISQNGKGCPAYSVEKDGIKISFEEIIDGDT